MSSKQVAASVLAIAFMVGLGSARSIASPFGYVVSGSGDFGVMDLSNGNFSHIGTVPSGLAGLAGDTSGNLFAYSSTTLGAPSNRLFSIDANSGAATGVGPTGPVPFTAFGSLTTGAMYGINTNNQLYHVDTSGAVTLVNSTGIAPLTQGFTTSLSGDATQLYYTEGTFCSNPAAPGCHNVDELWRIDPITGIAIDIGSTGLVDLVGSALVNGVLYGFTADDLGSTPALYTINLLTGSATFVHSLSIDDVFGGDPQPAPSPVPEPASFAIFGTALVGLCLIRRRRRSM